MKQKPLWWLSYADNGGFRGLVVTRAESFLSACMTAHRLRISPGGQVQGIRIDQDDEWRIPESYRNRLLTAEEAKKLAEDEDKEND
jgi:hypothetical protein